MYPQGVYPISNILPCYIPNSLMSWVINSTGFIPFNMLKLSTLLRAKSHGSIPIFIMQKLNLYMNNAIDITVIAIIYICSKVICFRPNVTLLLLIFIPLVFIFFYTPRVYLSSFSRIKPYCLYLLYLRIPTSITVAMYNATAATNATDSRTTIVVLLIFCSSCDF